MLCLPEDLRISTFWSQSAACLSRECTHSGGTLACRVWNERVCVTGCRRNKETKKKTTAAAERKKERKESQSCRALVAELLFQGMACSNLIPTNLQSLKAEHHQSDKPQSNIRQELGTRPPNKIGKCRQSTHHTKM